MGASTVACRSCNRDIPEQQGRRVADWTFCEDCFAALLERPRVEAPVIPPPREQPGVHCSLCQGPLAAGEGMDLGTVRLCVGCAGVMRALAEQDETPEGLAGQGAAPEVVHEPVNWAWTACAGCGRRVQERASKAHGGRPYCPDCFHALPVQTPQVPSPAASPVLVSGEGECDGCGRGVSASDAEVLQGFQICLACRTTDEALALDLARARHRRRLVALKAQMLE